MSTKSSGSSGGTTGTDFSQGLGGLASGSNNQFDVGSASGGPQPMAGLTGVQSGMGNYQGGTPPSLIDGQSQYQFVMPTDGSANMKTLGQSLGMGAQIVGANSPGQTTSGHGAGQKVAGQTFSPSLSDSTTGGSSSGNGLLALLQKLQVGKQ